MNSLLGSIYHRYILPGDYCKVRIQRDEQAIGEIKERGRIFQQIKDYSHTKEQSNTMANQITGRIVSIGDTVQIASRTGGSPFMKREFLLDATTHDPYTGERSQYENIVPLEVSGDKCAELDAFRTGDVITVSFALQGREWTNQDGQTKRMVSIRCYKVEARKPAQKQQPAQPAPQPAPPIQQFPPSVDANGNPQADLPF